MRFWASHKEDSILKIGLFLVALFGVLFITSLFPAIYFYSDEGARLSHLLMRSALIALTPILFLPLIYWVSMHKPIFSSGKNILLHILLSVIFSFLFLVIFQLMIFHILEGIFFLSLNYAQIESILVRQFFAIGSILFFTYWGLVVLLGVEHYIKELGRIQRKSHELESQLEIATLSSLKAQLKPHFLFNTLSMIDQMIPADPATAARMVDKLETLLKTTYDRTGSESWALREEVAFIKKYLAIETHRFQDRLKVAYAVDPETTDRQIPRYLLQPLVENALIHGVGRTMKSCTIEIKSEPLEDGLRIIVKDNGPGIPQRTSANGTGIGLKNVRERIRLYFGEAATISLLPLEPQGVISEILIPARYLKPAVAD